MKDCKTYVILEEVTDKGDGAVGSSQEVFDKGSAHGGGDCISLSSSPHALGDGKGYGDNRLELEKDSIEGCDAVETYQSHGGCWRMELGRG